MLASSVSREVDVITVSEDQSGLRSTTRSYDCKLLCELAHTRRRPVGFQELPYQVIPDHGDHQKRRTLFNAIYFNLS